MDKLASISGRDAALRSTRTLGAMVVYYVLGAIAVISIGLSVWGTVAIWRSVKYDRRQKFLQFILVWLLPYIGAVFVLYFAREPTNVPADFTDREMRPENAWWGVFR